MEIASGAVGPPPAPAGKWRQVALLALAETLATLRLVPALLDPLGWRWAFAVLALGPAFGIAAMLRLRRLPEAARMASGNR